MKKHRKPMLVMFCLLAGFLFCGKLSLNTLAASSDTAYQRLHLFPNDKIGPKEKVGKYYLWLERGKDGAVKYLKAAKSKSAKGTAIVTDSIDPIQIVSNGETVYYVRRVFKAGDVRSSLMQVNIATKKSTVLKKSFDGPTLFSPGTGMYAYGKYVYYKSEKNNSIVRLDTKTKKTKVVVSKIGRFGFISFGKERYMYIRIEKPQNKLSVYDCKTGKLRTIRAVANRDTYLNWHEYKNKLYIAETKTVYHDADEFDYTSSFKIYTYNLSGSGKKVFMKSTKYLNAPFFNDNYCYYDTPDGGYRRVNLKTKKVQTISKKVYESKF